MDPQPQENRLLAALGYPIWIIALVIILTDKKNDPFMRRHGWQGLFFGLAWVVVAIAISVVSVIPVIGWIIAILGMFLPLVWLILAIVYAMKAYRGEDFEIPFVSDFSRRYAEGTPTA